LSWSSLSSVKSSVGYEIGGVVSAGFGVTVGVTVVGTFGASATGLVSEFCDSEAGEGTGVGVMVNDTVLGFSVPLGLSGAGVGFGVSTSFSGASVGLVLVLGFFVGFDHVNGFAKSIVSVRNVRKPPCCRSLVFFLTLGAAESSRMKAAKQIHSRSHRHMVISNSRAERNRRR